MAIELGTAYVSIVPSAKGIEANLARELSPVSAAAATEGTKAGKALGGNVARGLNSSIAKLSGLASGFGVPFAAQLATINSRFDLTSAKASTFAATLANIGKTELVAAGVGIAVIGTSAVHAADQFEISRARLETAVKNTGGEFEGAAKGVGVLDNSFVKLGFNTSDTENSLSRLTAATKSVATATKLMGLAADIARARNIPLVQATDLLAKAANGTYTGLRKLGIVSKEDVASFHSLGDVTDFLSQRFGGQASAFADTFAGKMAALHAQANQLEVTIGTALIPKIQALASGTVGAVQGFENINRSTNGFIGKAVAIGAVVPVGVFALEKLNKVGGLIVGQYGKAADALKLTTAATEAEAVANEAAAAATVPLVTAQQAEVAAALESVAADQALAAIQFELAQSASVDAAALVELAAASEAATVAQANLAAASASAAGAGIATKAAAGASALAIEASVVGVLAEAFGAAKFQQSTRDMGGLAQGAQAAAQAFSGLIPGVQVVEGALHLLGVGHKKNAEATKEDTVASLQNALAKAEEKLENDQLAGNTKALAGDKANVAKINGKLSAAEAEVADALGVGTKAAEEGKFAYLGLADSVKTAADALTEVSKHAFIKFDAQVSVDTDKTNVASALDALNNPDTGSSGGGGGQTATAKALEEAQKNLTLRDSKRGIAQADQAVTDAETALTRAQDDQSTAATALRAAQENYRTTLQGVARDSKAAKDATDALTQAQNDKAGAKLDVNAAKRALATAKNDKDLLSLAVKDARDKLAQDKNGGTAGAQFVETPTGSKQIASVGGGASPEDVRKDQIALNDAIIAQKGANDTVKRAELDLSNARIQARQRTQDAAEAQRVYNGTINGFPPASREAKTAQDQLTQAQQGAETAAEGVRHAQDDLTTAINNTADAALALLRAQADLDGKLTASSGASNAGKKLESLQTRANNAATAIKQLAIDAANSDLLAGHSIGHSIAVEIQTLQAYASANPILAGLFGPALAELDKKFEDALNAQFGARGPGVGHIRRHAAGGKMRAGELGIVGEEGPELFVPDVGGTIVPNHSLANSRPMAGAYGGGGGTVNVYALDPRTASQLVIKALEEHCNVNTSLPRGIRTAP